jgi:hypothetical protein
MNRKNMAIAAMLVAIALSVAVFTMPTRQALAWGFFGSTKVDQRINQLNKCTNQSPDNNYQQQSYDPNSDNKPSTDSLNQTTSGNHGNTANQAISGNANNTKNQVSSGDDNSDNKQPNSSNGDEHNNHLVICINKANNLAQFN